MKKIVVARGISNFCDELWNTALPLAFASAGLLIADLGYVQSAFATGDLLGFLLLPLLSIHFNSKKLSIWSDFTASFTSIVLGCALWFYGLTPPLLILLNFILGLSFSIWFANFDATMASFLKKDQIVSYHRLLQISLNSALIIAPLVAVFFNTTLGLAGIAIFNGLSFLLQVFTFSHSTNDIELSAQSKNLRDFYSLGFQRFKTSPVLFHQTLVSLAFKIYYAIIPYLVFHFSKRTDSEFSAGTLFTAIGLGMVISAFTHQAKAIPKTGSEFIKYSLFMALFGFFVFSIAFSIGFSFVFIVGTLFLWGFIIARYQIYFRSLRQLIEPASSFASIVAIQGLSVRILGPMIGFLFPLLYNRTHPPYSFASLGLVLVLFVGTSLFYLNKTLKEKEPL